MLDVLEEKAKGFLKQLFGDTNEKRVQHLQPYVDKANSFEAAMQKLTDESCKVRPLSLRPKSPTLLKTLKTLSSFLTKPRKCPGRCAPRKTLCWPMF